MLQDDLSQVEIRDPGRQHVMPSFKVSRICYFPRSTRGKSTSWGVFSKAQCQDCKSRVRNILMEEKNVETIVERL